MEVISVKSNSWKDYFTDSWQETIKVTESSLPNSPECQFSVYRLDSVIGRILAWIGSRFHENITFVDDSSANSPRYFAVSKRKFEKLIISFDRTLKHPDWIQSAFQTWKIGTEKKKPASLQETYSDFFKTGISTIDPSREYFTIAFNHVDSIYVHNGTHPYRTDISLKDGRKTECFLTGAELKKLIDEKQLSDKITCERPIHLHGSLCSQSAQEILNRESLTLIKPGYLMDARMQRILHQDCNWSGISRGSGSEMKVMKEIDLSRYGSLSPQSYHFFYRYPVAMATLEDYIQKIYYVFPGKIKLIKDLGFDDTILQLAIKHGKLTLLYRLCFLIAGKKISTDSPPDYFHELIENQALQENLEKQFQDYSVYVETHRSNELQRIGLQIRTQADLAYMTETEYRQLLTDALNEEFPSSDFPDIHLQLQEIISKGQLDQAIKNLKLVRLLKSRNIKTDYDNTLTSNLLWNEKVADHINEKIRDYKTMLLKAWEDEKSLLFPVYSCFNLCDVSIEKIDEEIQSAIENCCDYSRCFKRYFPGLVQHLKDEEILEGNVMETRLKKILVGKDSLTKPGKKPIPQENYMKK